MNIFVLDLNPAKAAQYHNDKHCVKMVLESAQLLSSAHHVLNSPVKEHCYKLAYKNHPCAIWTRESSENYNWLLSLFIELSFEYTIRYGKEHKSYTTKAEFLDYNPCKEGSLTDFVLCMPDYCKIPGDPVASYRKYYLNEKRHIGNWKTEIPDWWTLDNLVKNIS